MSRDAYLRPPRPQRVRIASWLLLGVAVLSAAQTAATEAAMRHLDQFKPAYLALVVADRQHEALLELSGLRQDLVFNISLSIAGMLALTVLGIAVRWPSRLARGFACGFDIAFVIAAAFGIANSPETRIGDTSAPGALGHAARQLLASWYPLWQNPATTIGSIVLVVATGMLVSSTAGDYYRAIAKEAQPGLWSVLPSAAQRESMAAQREPTAGQGRSGGSQAR